MPPTIAKKSTRSSKRQLRELVHFMTSNVEFARGNVVGQGAIKRNEETWQQLANYLTDFGPQKSVEQWKVTWRGLKSKARSRHSGAKKLQYLANSTDLRNTATENKEKPIKKTIKENPTIVNPVRPVNSEPVDISRNNNDQNLNDNAISEDDSIIHNLISPTLLSPITLSPSETPQTGSSTANPINGVSKSKPNLSQSCSGSNIEQTLRSVVSRLTDIQEDNNTMLKNIGKTMSELLETTKKHNDSITNYQNERIATEKERNAIERQRNALKSERNAINREKNEILRLQASQNTLVFKTEEEEGEEDVE